MKSLVLAMLLGVVSPCNAALVSVAFEGSVSSIGASLPHDFTLGEHIEGEYVYESLTPVSANSWGGPQHSAIRYFSLRSAGGFFASINFGTISPFKAGSYNGPRRDSYSVTSLPPIVLFEEVHDGTADDDGSGLPGDLPDIIRFGPDIDAAIAMTLASRALGFPEPAGAFLNLTPLSINLMLSGSGLLADRGLSTAPPLLNSAEQAKGWIAFSPWSSSVESQRVEFALTRLEVIPEPEAGTVAAFGACALLLFARNYRSIIVAR